MATRHSVRLNGFTAIALTRLDVLGFLPSLQICVGYRLDGKMVGDFPANIRDLERCEPIYEEVPGWETPLEDVRRFEDLPPAARSYVGTIERLVDCPVGIVSVGSAREQSIIRSRLV